MSDWLTRLILFLLPEPLKSKAFAKMGFDGNLVESGASVEAVGSCSTAQYWPLESAAQLSDQIKRSMAALQQACNRVEADFLNMGERLQSIYAQAVQMTKAAQSALEHMGMDSDKSVCTTIIGTAFQALADFEPEQSIIAGRMLNIRTICDHLRKLHPLTGNLNRTAKALKIVAININIESCRAGEYQDSFSVLSQEIRTLSNTVTVLARTLRNEIQTTTEKLETMQKAIQANLNRFSQVADDTRNMVEQAEPRCQALTARSVSALQRASVDAEAISSSTGQIVVNLQIHDNVSQRIEHIVEALADARRSIQQPDSDAKNNDVYSDPIAPIDANLELQHAQLEHIIADIDRVFHESAHAFNAIGDTIRAITAGILQIAWGHSSAGADRGNETDSIDSLRVVLEKIRNLVGQGDKTAEELRRIGSNATEAVSRIDEHVEQVRNVNFDIHLKALNAIFKSTHLGNRGRAIGALVQEMKDLAEQSNQMVEQIESISRAIMEQSGQLQAGLQAGISDRQARTAVSFDKLDKIMQNFFEVSTAFTQRADEMGALSHTIDTAIRAAADRLIFLTPFIEALRAQLGQLEDCRGQLAPWMTSTSDTTLLDKSRLSNRYTMQQERNIHTAVLDPKAAGSSCRAVDIQQTDSSSEVLFDDTSPDDFGKNVELF
jgi:methyl-accepting chemotaxis protein